MRLKVLSVSYLLAFALAGGTRASGETLGEGWPLRRQVTVRQIASDAPGENIAWAEIYVTADHKSDGSDIRVTTADRNALVDVGVVGVDS